MERRDTLGNIEREHKDSEEREIRHRKKTTGEKRTTERETESKGRERKKARGS